jgi:hypothetical protein
MAERFTAPSDFRQDSGRESCDRDPMPCSMRRSIVFLAAVILCLPRPAAAQGCDGRQPVSLGVTAGRSSPYVGLQRGSAGESPAEFLAVRAGFLAGARGELPVGGPWRARLGLSTASWQVEARTLAAGNSITSRSAGSVRTRSIEVAIGRRGGRSPVCGYVLAGGGLYILRLRDRSIRAPGAAFVAGIDIPAGGRGVFHVEVQLRAFETGSRYPFASTTALAASLQAGWSVRFGR